MFPNITLACFALLIDVPKIYLLSTHKNRKRLKRSLYYSLVQWLIPCTTVTNVYTMYTMYVTGFVFHLSVFYLCLCGCRKWPRSLRVLLQGETRVTI